MARTAAHDCALLWQAERVRMAQERALAVPPAALLCPLPHGRPRLTVPLEHLLSPVPLSLVPLSSVPLSRIPLLLVPLRPVRLTAGLGYRADRPSGASHSAWSHLASSHLAGSHLGMAWVTLVLDRRAHPAQHPSARSIFEHASTPAHCGAGGARADSQRATGRRRGDRRDEGPGCASHFALELMLP